VLLAGTVFGGAVANPALGTQRSAPAASVLAGLPKGFTTSSTTTDAAGDVYVIGSGATGGTRLYYRQGAAWSSMAVPGHTYSIAALSPTQIWVGGYHALKGGMSQAFIDELVDGKWTSQALPPLLKGQINSGRGNWWSEVTSMSASSPTNVWAAGELAAKKLGFVALHWDGVKWSVSEVPVPGSDGAFAVGVASSSATDAWLVTTWAIMHWDGVKWSLSKQYQVGVGFEAMASNSPTCLWAVGLRNTNGLAIHYNGTTWTSVKVPARQPGQNMVNAVSVTTGCTAWLTARDETKRFADHALVARSSGGKLFIVPTTAFTPRDYLYAVLALSPKTALVSISVSHKHGRGTGYLKVVHPR
jgi:hypothetical protein